MKSIHYTLGVSVLILMLIRTILKLTNKDPDITPTAPHWQIAALKTVHGILYLLFNSLP